MGQRDGVSVDFLRGQQYERRVTLAFIADVLQLEDLEVTHELLQSWVVEAAESLELPKRQVVIIEDTYILI